MSLQEGRLSKAECREVHSFRPFSNRDSGPTTSVTQTMVLQGEREGGLPSAFLDIISDLTFVQDHKQSKELAGESSVRELLSRVNSPSFQESELPAVFRSLVYSMRSLQHAQLNLIYMNIKGSRKSKKLFEDALPLLKTNPGISLMRDIIKSTSLDQSIVDTWFSSLTFYKNPTRAMLTALSTFFDPATALHHSALLGISSLASTFCTANTDCLQFAEMRELVSRLEQLLGSGCSTTNRREEDTMVLVLKGLRNIGLMTGTADTLRRCYKTKSNPMWVRVAAMETAQRMTCRYPDSQFQLLDSFRDRQEDSELRIGAYRAIMACPTDTVVEAVKELLSVEQVNQGKL